jgi:hypothetical protein
MESAQLRKDRRDNAMRRRGLVEDSCEVLDAEGTLWRESRSSGAGNTVKRYKAIPSRR